MFFLTLYNILYILSFACFAGLFAAFSLLTVGYARYFFPCHRFIAFTHVGHGGLGGSSCEPCPEAVGKGTVCPISRYAAFLYRPLSCGLLMH